MPAEATALFGVPFSALVIVVNLLGLPGLVAIFWYVDHRRLADMQAKNEKQQVSKDAKHDEQINTILNSSKDSLEKVLRQYKDDMREMRTFYQNNVLLVQGYEKLSGELAGIIRLNTQTMAHLTDAVQNNMYCPVLRRDNRERMNG